MPGASLALFADLGACHVQKSSVTICVLPAPSGWRATRCTACVSRNYQQFLSTPSGWRATPTGVFADETSDGISIHALRVEGDLAFIVFMCAKWISIHALRVEGDVRCLCRCLFGLAFLSTPSGWRATVVGTNLNVLHSIFLSTPSGWRATVPQQDASGKSKISIHALRVEGDRCDIIKI